MSDAGIELAFEQDLQAEQRSLLLHIDGSLRLTVADTPEGRERIDRAAFAALAASDDVQVTPAGLAPTERESSTGSRLSSGVPGGDTAERAPRKRNVAGSSPAGGSRNDSRAGVSCCRPAVYPGPSGIRYRHSFDCSRSPGEVFVTSAAVRDPMNLAGKLQAETLRVGLDDAVRRHPAGGTLTAVDDRCPSHETEKWWDCVVCSDRRVG